MGAGIWQRLAIAWRAFRQAAPPSAAQPRLDTLLDLVPAVIYARTCDTPSRLTYVSGNVQGLLGYDLDEVLSDPDFWISHLHADDRERCVGTLRALPRLGQLEMEYRLRAKDGSWRWLHDECRVIRAADGTCVEIVGSCLDVSGRHRSEQALARSETELRAAQARLMDALESSDDGFSVFDAEDRLIAFNSRYRDIYPTIADIIRPGVTFAELLRVSAQRGQYQGVTPDQVEEWVRHRLRQHHSPTGAFEQLLADGRWLEISERPTAEGGRVAIRRDITERKRFEDILRAELCFKQTLIDALPYPVFFKNTDLVYLGCNGAFAEALGKRVEDIVGKTLTETYAQDTADQFRRRDQELLTDGGIQHYETTFRWGDGSMRQIAIVKATFNGPDGQVAGLVGTIIDLTRQKATEEKLVQTAKLATLGQIASEVAHEMNQPLSILRMTAENSVERLRSGDLNGDTLAGKLAVMVEQAGRMADLIAHLRSFVRDGDQERRPFSPLAPVRAAIDLMHQQMMLDDIAVSVDLPDHAPDLTGQPNQLEQVVLALLSNARDAVCARHPPGARRIAVALESGPRDLVLTVRDNGGGIAEELWPQVFAPFFTTKQDDAGTGLGLSASANIVAALGGHLGGRNLGDGAEFRAIWPLDGQAPVAPPEPRPAAAKPCVLVVDDEPLAVECLTDFLTGRGYGVEAAISPLDALEIAKTRRFDAVLSDQRMPGMDGNVLISRLRQMQPGLPALMMSGGAMPLPPASEGPVVRLTKPLVLEELGHALDAVMRGTLFETAAAEPPQQPPPPALTAVTPAQRLWQMGELTAHLAHDFGQPLNIIRLSAENLLDNLTETHPGDDRLRRALSSAVEQCRRMQDMAGHLVAATRRPKTPPTRFSTLAVLRAALAAFQDRVRMQDIDFSFHADTGLPPVSGYPDRLGEGLRQLLDNACQALAAEALGRHAEFPPWKARLRVECRRAEDGGVAIVIADNGPGLPVGTLEALEAGSGKGLGLPIAQGVVAEMGGTLDFAPGPGAEVRIHLPAARRRVLVDANTAPAGPWQVVDSPEQAEAALLTDAAPESLPDRVERLRRAAPHLAIVVIAPLAPDQARAAVAAGATLVLPPDTSPEQIADSLDECLGGLSAD